MKALLYHKELTSLMGGGTFQPLLLAAELQKKCDITLVLNKMTNLAEVCRIRFTSNKGGMHIVRIGSTPLTDNVNSYGYNLSLSCDGNVEYLEIPDDASSSVPVSFYLPYSAGFTYKDIFMDAVLSELDSMTPGTFKATVTIEVESNA